MFPVTSLRTAHGGSWSFPLQYTNSRFLALSHGPAPSENRQYRLYLMLVPGFWQQGLQGGLWGEDRGGPCWAQLVPDSSKRPPQDRAEPLSLRESLWEKGLNAALRGGVRERSVINTSSPEGRAGGGGGGTPAVCRSQHCTQGNGFALGRCYWWSKEVVFWDAVLQSKSVKCHLAVSGAHFSSQTAASILNWTPFQLRNWDFVRLKSDINVGDEWGTVSYVSVRSWHGCVQTQYIGNITIPAACIQNLPLKWRMSSF